LLIRIGKTQVLKLTACAVILFCGAALAAPLVEVTVRDQGGQPAARVHVEIRSGANVAASAETDAAGHASFPQLTPGRYTLTAGKEGFQTAQSEIDLTESGATAIDVTLMPVHRESFEVHDTATPLETGGSVPNSVTPQIAKDLPNRPATVADALPLLPGVARSQTGGLQISGSGEQRSALIVNSADVTDPATGQFGRTVPIDSVETLNVYQTPFLAEYGRFTAGLVSVETRRGTDKWKWELNDPFPDFRIRSYHMQGLKDATPRLNFQGPLIPGKLYFSEGFEYEMRKTEVYTLTYPNNQKKQEGLNSFSQFDWVVSAKHLVTATLHAAPERLQFANINFLNPEPTSPDAGTHDYTAALGDRLTIGGGLLENSLSATRFDARVWGKGPVDLTVAPWGNSGNYFAQQDRTASRLGWSSTFSFAAVNAAGTHNFKVGTYIANSSDKGEVNEHPIDILDGTGLLAERISFTGGQPFRMSDTEFAIFGQDHWNVSPKLAVDLGIRTESQEVSESFRVAPRAGIAWTPSAVTGTVVRAGFGLFYDRVPLNVYSFSSYPNRVVTPYDGTGQISGGPFFYENGLGGAIGRFPFVFQEPGAGNFSPRSATWSAQIEQPVTRFVKLRVGYMQNDSAGLVVLNSVAPDPVTNIGAYTLSGAGRSRYRQFETTARVHVLKSSSLFFSYVRSRARGDLNGFTDFLGSYPVPVIRPNQFATLPTDLPNRFLAWGSLQLPRGFRVAPMFEYRSGFPYAVTDALQNYVGVPNQNRYPNFLSIDSRVSKDFPVSPKYTIRLSLSGFNLTDHFNPEALHTDIADPAFGAFVGQHGRRYTADFDIVF
jgi:hypothetical protein